MMLAAEVKPFLTGKDAMGDCMTDAPGVQRKMKTSSPISSRQMEMSGAARSDHVDERWQPALSEDGNDTIWRVSYRGD